MQAHASRRLALSSVSALLLLCAAACGPLPEDLPQVADARGGSEGGEASVSGPDAPSVEDAAATDDAPSAAEAGREGGARRDASSTDAAADASAADASAADASASLPLGSVSSLRSCALSSLLPGARCEEVTVSCPGLEDATLRLLVAEPTASERGTVVLGSGSAGASPIEQAATDPRTNENLLVPQLERLRAAGFRVVERAWQGDARGDRGWLRGTGGPAQSACRYATALRWLRARFTAGRLCALGFSGGSLELSTAMGRYDSADLLDYSLFVSGPTLRLDDACVSPARPAWASSCASAQSAHPWECSTNCQLSDDIALLIDTAYGTTMCSSRSAANADRLYADSATGSGGRRSFPRTRLGSLFGLGDCATGAPIQGTAYAAGVTGPGGAAPETRYIPGAPHLVYSTPAGATAVGDMLLAGCGAP